MIYINTSRVEQITNIIQQRQPLGEKITKIEANLISLAAALHRLENHRNQLLTKVEDANSLVRLNKIDFSSIFLLISSVLVQVKKLQSRCSRDTINIGVVGRARQGKSRLLQSLTGLTSGEIPDGDRQHCTGVRSTIYHCPGVETYGEVWFHTEVSFLDEVIYPYYDKLELGAKPITLGEFGRNSLPPLPHNLPGYAQPGAMYEHLGRYHLNWERYRYLLEEASPRRITREEIREYVAQDTRDGERVFFNYLAVKEVKIICNFPNSDVGQIALVDMPGLGDTGLGDEARLVKTLGEDVDAVLLIRMPKSSGDYWADVDVRLYDTARSALVELPIDKWCFLILNRTAANSKNGDNFQNCQDLLGSIKEKHINVVESAIANCADSDAAGEILDRVLDYLAANIATLDREYTSSCQESLCQMENSIQIELDKARKALNSLGDKDNWFPLFLQLFDILWDNLTSSLEELLRNLKADRDREDGEFKAQVAAAIETCRQDTGIPSIEEIETRRDRTGGYPNAYYQYLNEIRAHLSQHFLALDKGLKQSIQQVKSQIADILIKDGNLDSLSKTRGSELINAIASLLPEDAPKLKLGFQILSEFDLSYRGLIQHRIRRHLDRLTPDETNLTLSKSPSAREIADNLQTLHAETLYNCETALEDLLCEPSQAAFAIVEEFVDRILRAEGVKIEWRIFLERYRSQIWQKEFQQYCDRARIRQEWLHSLELAENANQWTVDSGQLTII